MIGGTATGVSASDAITRACRTMSAGPEIFTPGGAMRTTHLPAGVAPRVLRSRMKL